MNNFVINPTRNGGYSFNLKGSNGQVILTGETYLTKSACKNAIKSIMLNSQDEINFTRHESKNGGYYFSLKAKNGEILGISQIYASEAGREVGIYAVKLNSQETELI